jgi:hypothetical protein
MLWIAAAAPILIAWGAWRGARRLLAVVVVFGAAGLAAAEFGPKLHDRFVAITGLDNWARAGASWLIVYLATVVLATGLFDRLVPVRPTAQRGSWFRIRGAAVGGVAAGLLLWGMIGNLSEVALEALPERKPDAVVDLRRPFEILRACRTFGTLTPAEADHLAGRPEVVAMLDNGAMEKLLRTPGVLRRVSQVADGDWTALGSLATDDTVKTAMHDPVFLERVRNVDVFALAAELERLRAAGKVPRVDGTPTAGLPAFVRDPRFVAHAEREWSDSPPQIAPRDKAGETAAYWRNVGTVLDWYEGRPAVTRFLPQFVDPSPAIAPPKSRDATE